MEITEVPLCVILQIAMSGCDDLLTCMEGYIIVMDHTILFLGTFARGCRIITHHPSPFVLGLIHLQ